MADMPGAGESRTAVRTVLEQRIKERRETLEQFAEFAEQFAREHGESGTLSVRHLQRLVAGRRSKERPLGQLQPATTRLLERIFAMPIDHLLAAPDDSIGSQGAHVLRVAVALVMRNDEVLLVCRRGDGDGHMSWQFPAGMVKPGQSAAAVAVQETLAETGVHCIVERELGSRVHPMTNVVCDYVLCEYLGGDARNLDLSENTAVLWVHRERVTRLIPAAHIFSPVLRELLSSPCASYPG